MLRLQRITRNLYQQLRWRLHDAAQNFRHTRRDRRILVIRHPMRTPEFYEVILDWLAEHHP